MPQIILHKADQPDIVVYFFDADGLAGKDLAEIDFFLAETDAAATRDHDCSSMSPPAEARRTAYYKERHCKKIEQGNRNILRGSPGCV